MTGQLTANNLSSTSLQTALSGKVDNSQVLTNVPSGALFTDTVYTHPATHSIAEVSGLQTALNGKVDDSQVLTNVPSGAVFTDTVYSHPAMHSIAEVSGLQSALDDASLSIWHAGSSQYVATSHLEFTNCSQTINFALSPTAWTIDPTPPMSSVTGLTSALAGKQALITNNLTLGATAPLLTLAKGACQADWYIDGGNSTNYLQLGQARHWQRLLRLQAQRFMAMLADIDRQLLELFQ